MIETIGPLSLGGALMIAIVGVVASIFAARRGTSRPLSVARWSIFGMAVLLSIAYVALMAAFLMDQFQFEYVRSYSEHALPFGYKLAAVWAGQEGSLLLWAWMLTVMCSIAILGYRNEKGPDHAIAVGVMTIVCGFFAVLLVFATDPFALVEGAIPANGRGLNPMLQDPGMIIHPPILFLGYAGFTIPFAVMVGVLVAGRTDNHWLALIRRWFLVSWLFLTAGIVIGAWWAYMELGWGGYWAWDPVENASLLPWLTATALLHSMMAQQHRGMFKFWNASLIAATFILCIFGTYLTRSGVVSSVHAFGESLLGTLFLIFLVICLLASVALIIWRRAALKSEHQLEELISREGAFLAANVLLTLMMLTTLIGTIFPLLSGIVSTEPITVGPAFYNTVVAPMGMLLVALMSIGPVLAFGKLAAKKIANDLMIPTIAALIVTGTVAFGLRVFSVWALICTAITVLGTSTVVVNFIRSAAARRRSTGEGILVASMRLIDRDHRRYGGQLAHLGVMLLVVGIVGSSLFDTEKVTQLRTGESIQVAGQTLTFHGLSEVQDVNFLAVEATISLTNRTGNVYTFRPQIRRYNGWTDQNNREVAILTSWREDVYVSLAGWEAGGEVAAISVKINPLVVWIWIGGIVMSAGCLFSLMPRLLPQARTARAGATETSRPQSTSTVTTSS